MNDLDLNKTPLTHKITALAAAFLDAHGFKPIETEVSVAPGWIADLASFAYPTMTEAKKLKLIKDRKLLHPDQIQDMTRLIYTCGPLLTAIVEVKVTKADLKKDWERKFKCRMLPAHLCYLAYPKGLIDKKELPMGWHGIECSEDGERVIRRHHSFIYTIHPQHPGAICDLIAAVAIRRAHRTRYREMRDWMRSYRAEQKADEKRWRTQDVIIAISGYLAGKGWAGKAKDIDTAIKNTGAKIRETKTIRESLDFLETLKIRQEADE